MNKVLISLIFILFAAPAHAINPAFLTAVTGQVTSFIASLTLNGDKEFALGAGTYGGGPVDIEYTTDGTRLFIIDNHSEKIHTLDLSIAYNPSSAVRNAAREGDTSVQTTQPSDIAFSEDFTELIVSDYDQNSLFYYTMSAEDPSTISYDSSKSVNVVSYINDVRDIWMNADRTEMHLMDSNPNGIKVFTLSEAMNPSTLSEVPSKALDLSSVITEETRSFSYYNNGLNMAVTQTDVSNNDDDAVWFFRLSEAYNPSTASVISNLTIDLEGIEAFATDVIVFDILEEIHLTGAGGVSSDKIQVFD